MCKGGGEVEQCIEGKRGVCKREGEEPPPPHLPRAASQVVLRSLAGPDPHGRESLVKLQRHSCSAQSAQRPLFKYLLTTTVFDDIRVVQGVNSFA